MAFINSIYVNKIYFKINSTFEDITSFHGFLYGIDIHVSTLKTISARNFMQINYFFTL